MKKTITRLIKNFFAAIARPFTTMYSWLKDFKYYLGFQGRLISRIIRAKFGYKFMTGIRVGVNVELGKVRLVFQIRNGSEYTMDMSPAMADHVIGELTKCRDAIEFKSVPDLK